MKLRSEIGRKLSWHCSLTISPSSRAPDPASAGQSRPATPAKARKWCCSTSTPTRSRKPPRIFASPAARPRALRTPCSAAYTTSKHGVLGFTKALAVELGKEGVRVNAIGPGFIETNINANVRATNPALVQAFVDHTPLARTGKPEDIVGPAIFLASDMSAYVTGTIVMVDGGYRTV